MLNEWQKKYPASFETHRHLLTVLSAKDAECLSNLLGVIDELGLLDELTVDCVIGKPWYDFNNVYFIIDKLAELHFLNREMLQELLAVRDYDGLKQSIEWLLHLSLLSEDSLSILFSSTEPMACANFIQRASEANVTFDFIKYFLTHEVVMRGLSDAITLFDFSRFDYQKQHFQLFSVLTSVLANPLCSTIFAARLRCFALYSQPREPLNEEIANDIIGQLDVLGDEEQRVRVFFDFFADYRPFPESQKFIVDIDVATLVANALDSKIEEINRQNGHLQATQMKRKLSIEGGDKAMFDRIKYTVANEIETNDFCSTRRYDRLMDEIWCALMQPQVLLSPVSRDSISMSIDSGKGHSMFMMGSSTVHHIDETAMECTDKPLL